MLRRFEKQNTCSSKKVILNKKIYSDTHLVSLETKFSIRALLHLTTSEKGIPYILAPQLHLGRELISAMPEKPEELPCSWGVALLFMDHFLFQLLPVETSHTKGTIVLQWAVCSQACLLNPTNDATLSNLIKSEGHNEQAHQGRDDISLRISVFFRNYYL